MNVVYSLVDISTSTSVNGERVKIGLLHKAQHLVMRSHDVMSLFIQKTKKNMELLYYIPVPKTNHD